jgi:hypothetical protein
MPFQKGRSGNPAGKKPGTKDWRSQLRDLFEPQAPALVQKAIDLALGGDITALRLCIDWLIPPLKAREEPVSLEALTGTLTEQGHAILTAMAAGTLAPPRRGGCCRRWPHRHALPRWTNWNSASRPWSRGARPDEPQHPSGAP